jgi:hypothetical protein
MARVSTYGAVIQLLYASLAPTQPHATVSAAIHISTLHRRYELGESEEVRDRLGANLRAASNAYRAQCPTKPHLTFDLADAKA